MRWPRITWDDVGMALLILTALAALGLQGCAAPGLPRPPALEGPPGADAPPIAPPVAGDGTVAQWVGQVARLRSQLLAAEGELGAAKEREKEAARARMWAICQWCAGLCLLGTVACAVLAWVLPLGRRRLLLATAGCMAGAALAVALGQALPWLALGGTIAVCIAGLVAVAWVVRELRAGALDAASEWRRYAAGLDEPTRKALDRKSMERQKVPAVVSKILAALPGLPHPDRHTKP